MTGYATKQQGLHQFFPVAFCTSGHRGSFPLLSVIKNCSRKRFINSLSLLRAKGSKKSETLALFLCEKQESLCENF